MVHINRCRRYQHRLRFYFRALRKESRQLVCAVCVKDKEMYIDICGWLWKQVPPGTPVVNALSKQRAMLENILRACVGLAPENNMILEYK